MFINCVYFVPWVTATAVLASNPATAPAAAPVAAIGIGTYIISGLLGLFSVIVGYKFVKK